MEKIHKEKDCIVSIPITLVPFLQNNDGTRMQMSSNQMRQSLDIFQSEYPLVETGLEQYYLNHSELCITAPESGVIIDIQPSFIVLKLDKPEFGISDLKILPTNRYKYRIFAVVGQYVKKNDILGKVVKHNNNESFKNILNGTNLLTAINSFYGFNYEDAIVISESCFEKLSHQEKVVEMIQFNNKQVPLSLVDNDYIPFLEPGTEVKVGDFLALIKNSDLTNINELISPPIEKRSPCNGIIEKVDIYINNFHNSTRELSLYLTQRIERNIKEVNDILTNICHVYNAFSTTPLTTDKIPEHVINEIQHLTGMTDKAKWKFKNVEIDVLVRYTITRKSEFNIGDKLANRHGNKGTTPIIVPDKSIFQISGKPVDVVINLMGIPGRMNLGQVYELWMSNVVVKVRNIAKSLALNNQENEAKEFLKDFYRTIDKTDGQYILNSINFEKDVKQLISGISFIAPPFDCPDIYELKNILEKYKVKTIYDVYDPWGKSTIKMPVGYIFWEKLHHLAEEKITARSVGGYNKKTMQPLSGKKIKGGQKFGEMEVWALLAHDSNTVLKEMLGVKSDDIVAKNKILHNIMDMGRATFIKGSSKTSETFLSYLRTIGLDFQDVKDE